MPFRYLLSQWLQQQVRGQLEGALSAEGEAASGEEFAVLPRPLALVCCALGLEAGGLVDRLRAKAYRVEGITYHYGRLGDAPIAVVETGVGMRAAERSSSRAMQHLAPRWVVATGFAGGLAEGVERGHLLMADQLLNLRGERLDTGLRLDRAAVAATPGLHLGPLLTVDKIVSTRQAKRELAAAHGATACDMETFAIGRACREAGTRCVAVRIISDGWDDEIAPEIARMLAAGDTAGNLGAAAAAVWKRPGVVKELWRLRDQAIAHGDQLAGFLLGVLEQLAAATPVDEPPAEPAEERAERPSEER